MIYSNVTARDCNPRATEEYRQRTAEMPAALSCQFSCKRCGKFKSTTGSRSFAIPNSCRRVKLCADCIKEKGHSVAAE